MAGAPKLIALSEQLRGKTFELTGDSYSCGRVAEREIQINDPTISSYHCDFVRTENGFTVRDRNSTNGTRVNNIPIVEQELQNSDIVQVGGVEMLFDCDDKSVTTVIRTQTGINLGHGDMDISTVTKMENMSPIKNRSKKDGKGQKTVLLIVIVLIALIVGLLAYFFWLQLSERNNATPAALALPASVLD